MGRDRIIEVSFVSTRGRDRIPSIAAVLDPKVNLH